MPTRISAALGVSHKQLIQAGAYDGFVDVDSRLYVDPHLLSTDATPELSDSRARFEKYFHSVLKLLAASKKKGDIFRRRATEMLTFREISGIALGYAKHDTAGRAIGPRLAGELVALAKEIVDAGITDPEIFELIGILQEKIGADRVSDMTVSIILPNLVRFTQRVAKDLSVATTRYSIEDENFQVPIFLKNDKPVLLVPARILRHLPIARCWEDIDMVSAHNASLRRRVNKIIGNTWKQATSNRVRKSELREVLLRHPALIKDMIAQYRAKPAEPYNFKADPDGVQFWYDIAMSMVQQSPLNLVGFSLATQDDVVKLVRALCKRFAELVESNRLSRVFYSDDGTPRKEKIAQLTFYAVADGYCKANDLEISPETDAGAGPVDFKFSKGYSSRVNVEVKLSSNPKLVHAFQTQLPDYNAAENAIHSILLIIRTTKSMSGIKRVQAIATKAQKSGARVPEIVIVDGIPRQSASKRQTKIVAA